MRTYRNSPVLRYGIAVITVSAALILRFVAWDALGNETPFTFFYAALAVSAWFGGFGPGLLATLLGAASVAYFLLPPYFAFRVEVVHAIHLAMFTCTGILSSWLMGRLMAATRTAERAQEEAKQFAAKAQEGKRMLDALLEYIPESIAIIEAPDGTIRTMSGFGCRYFGRTREALQGIALESLVRPPDQIRDSEGRMPVRPGEPLVAPVIRDGNVISEQEWSIRHSDGRTDWLLCNAGPIRDESGKIVQAIITWHDITGRKRMEEELRGARIGLEARIAERTAELEHANEALEHERNKLVGVLTSMRDIVYIVNKDYEIEFANPAFEKAFGPLVRARKCHEQIHGLADVCPWCRNPEVFSGRSISWEWTSPRDGRVYDVFETPIVNKDGSVSKLKILHEITEIRRAEEERVRQHRQLETVWDISRSDLNLEALYARVLTEMISMTGSRYAFFGFLNADESTITIRPWSQQTQGDCRMHKSTVEYTVATAGLLGEAVRSSRPLIVNDYSEELDGKKGIPESHVELRRVLIVPIRSHGRTVLLSAVANKETGYTEEDAAQLSGFLASAILIVEKRKAEEALKHSQEELQRLSSRLLTAQEAERMRISHELHDELGQALTVIKLHMALIEMKLPSDEQMIREHCHTADEYVDRVIEETRRLSRDLCPSALENLGMTAALRRLVNDSMKASNIKIKANLEDIDDLLGSQQCILLYRVFQETLNNIIKHSGATEVDISGKKRDGRLRFELQDNGKGMAADKMESGGTTQGQGLGLAIMRERVRTLGGLLEIWSQKGAGTRLSFSIPVNPPSGGRQ